MQLQWIEDDDETEVNHVEVANSDEDDNHVAFLIDKAFLDSPNILICYLLISTQAVILTITLCWTRMIIILPGEN